MRGFKIHFEERDKLGLSTRLLIPIVCIALALVVCGLLMLALGYNPFSAYEKLFSGGFGSLRNISESILQAVPLMFCGLGVSVAFKMSLNNIGAEGQFTMGAFAATGIALYCPWIPSPLVIPAVLIGGFVAGGIWSALAVASKAFWGVNETIITLMFNYIALLFVDYFVYGPWRDTAATSTNLPYSERLPPRALMAYLGDTRITYALFIAIIAAGSFGCFSTKPSAAIKFG